MALSVATALKAKVEALGLGLTANLADRGGLRRGSTAPTSRTAPNRALPFVLIDEITPTVLGPLEDGQAARVEDQVQVELWQAWRQRPPGVGTPAEDPTLRDKLLKGLEGCRLDSVGDSVVYVCRVRDCTPVPEPDRNLLRHVMTVGVIRKL